MVFCIKNSENMQFKGCTIDSYIIHKILPKAMLRLGRTNESMTLSDNIFVPSFAKVSQRVSGLQIGAPGSTLGWSQMLTDGRTDVWTDVRADGKPDPYNAPCLRYVRQKSCALCFLCKMMIQTSIIIRDMSAELGTHHNKPHSQSV